MQSELALTRRGQQSDITTQSHTFQSETNRTETESSSRPRFLAFFTKTLFPLFAVLAAAMLHSQLPPSKQVAKVVQSTVPHVVVVGGGLAGLSAAAEALVWGARVTLIDKQRLGGNSAKATSGINAVLTDHQHVSGINSDSIEVFTEDILKSGQGRTDRRLAHTLSSKSAEAVSFLEGKLGRKLSSVAILGGHSYPRTHRFITPFGSKAMPIGFSVISALKNFLMDDRWKNRINVR